MDAKKIEIFGDILTVRWDGNVWVSPHNGNHYAHPRDAMRSEAEAYYLACGEDITDDDVMQQIEDDLDTMADSD